MVTFNSNKLANKTLTMWPIQSWTELWRRIKWLIHSRLRDNTRKLSRISIWVSAFSNKKGNPQFKISSQTRIQIIRCNKITWSRQDQNRILFQIRSSNILIRTSKLSMVLSCITFCLKPNQIRDISTKNLNYSNKICLRIDL